MTKSIAMGGRSERARALTVLARIIGQKRGINIVFRGGVEASTDGQTIFLPALNDVATETDAALLEGLLDHEAMHCRFTDFAFMLKPQTQAVYKKHPLMFPLCNILEDVWGEREQAKIYPGCFQSIKKSVDVMINLGLYRGRVGLANTAADALRGFILHALLGRLYDNQRLVAFGQEHKADLISKVGQQLTDEIWGLAVQVDQVKSTQKAFELAQKIFALIESHLEKLPEKSGPRKVLSDMLQASPKGGDIATMLENALQLSGGVAQNQNHDPESLVVSDILDRDLLQSADFSALSRPTSVSLGTKLEVLLETKIDADSSHGKSGKKITSRRISGISVGRTSIFRREEEVDGLDTAVELVLDLSASMFWKQANTSEEPHVIAKTAVYAVSDVLERHEVPFALTAYGRSVVEIKTFDQKWRRQKAYLDLDSLGGTSTTEVLQHSAQSISLRQERKRMVVLITDGNARNNATVIPVMNELAALGVNFTSIFIGDSGVPLQQSMIEAGYPVTRAANVQDLPLAMFTAIKTAF